MACIEDFRFEDKRIKIQEPADTSYSIGDVDGQTYLQINMYGSPYKQFKGKVSQVIQLDKNGAEKLIAILKQTFSL